MRNTHAAGLASAPVVTPVVARQIADLTERRYVALYPMGFSVIVADDGLMRFRIWDEDDLAIRLDCALAAVATIEDVDGWVLYDQQSTEYRILSADDVRGVIWSQ